MGYEVARAHAKIGALFPHLPSDDLAVRENKLNKLTAILEDLYDETWHDAYVTGGLSESMWRDG